MNYATCHAWIVFMEILSSGGRWEDCSLTVMAPVPPESRGEMYNVCRADDVVPGLYFLNPYKEYLGNEDECNSLGPALFTEQDVLTLPFGSV